MAQVSPLVEKFRLIDIAYVPNGHHFIGMTENGICVRCRACHENIEYAGMLLRDYRAEILESQYRHLQIIGARSKGAKPTGAFTKLWRQWTQQDSWFSSELTAHALAQADIQTDRLEPAQAVTLPTLRAVTHHGQIVMWSMDVADEVYSPYNTINS